MVEVNEMEKMPEGWKRVRLGDLIEEHASGEWGSEPKTLANVVPVIGTLNFEDNGKINFENPVLRNIPSNKLEKIKLKRGDILLEKSGGSVDRAAGRVVFVNKNFDGTCSNFVEILRINHHYKEEFVFYLFFWLYKTGLVGKYQQRTTGIINFKFKEYFKENIHIPPPSEQRKIDEILETADNAIEKTDAIIEKHKRIKQGLMQDLLTKGIDENGKIRSEETHKFKDSPLGRIPEEWEVVRLGEIAEITSSKRIYFDEYTEEGIPFYRSKEIIEKAQGLNIEKTLFIPENKYRFIEKHFGTPKTGDILITAVGTLGVIYVIKTSDEKFYFKDGNLLWLKNLTGSLIDIELLAYLFQEVFEKQKEILTIGTSQNALTIEKMKEMQIPLSPLPEQHCSASILSQIDETIEKEQKYKEKLERIKQGLMEDLLTGKVRVNHMIFKEVKV